MGSEVATVPVPITRVVHDPCGAP